MIKRMLLALVLCVPAAMVIPAGWRDDHNLQGFRWYVFVVCVMVAVELVYVTMRGIVRRRRTRQFWERVLSPARYYGPPSGQEQRPQRPNGPNQTEVRAIPTYDAGDEPER